MSAETEGHRLLRLWLERSGWTVVTLSEVSGIGQTTLHHLTRGRRVASLKTAIKLERATRGFVRINSWVEDPKEDT